MTEPTDESGAGSQNDGQPLDKTTASGKTPPRRDPKLVERDELLARMDTQIEERRQQENAEFLRSSDVDPRAFMLAQQMEREANGQPLASDTPPEESPNDGAESVEPIAQRPAVSREAQRISTKGEDPLGDFVIRVNGKPMFKTLVDGQEKLIPLEAARTQLQKHLAADVRLQRAAELQKQLDARAAAIQTTESQLRTRSRPTAEAPAELNLDNEAVELVRSLVNEPEDKAAARLARTLKTIRQASAPIDVKAIVKQAGDEAEARLVARDTNKAFASGFETFTQDYPDIAGDPDLFALADRKTDAIAAEHPEWAPGQVMMEAGKQTREWMKSIGAPVRATPAGQQPNNRQQRKENLRPMPTPHAVRPVTTPEQSDRQSPADAVAEMRKSRGQPQ